MNHSTIPLRRGLCAAFALSTLLFPVLADAVITRGGARTNVNRNVQANRNVNVNRNVNIDVDRHNDYHPLATAAAVVATGAAIGSIVHSIPPACSAVVINGVTYQQCGSSWYQPQYAGSQVTYIVVNPPR